ncbi:MAG: hypothetical protein FWE80_10140 [Oscillospiraceae bacterium]|nr:hypothetical protein [Oscillospiraceae bacterium]
MADLHNEIPREALEALREAVYDDVEAVIQEAEQQEPFEFSDIFEKKMEKEKHIMKIIIAGLSMFLILVLLLSGCDEKTTSNDTEATTTTAYNTTVSTEKSTTTEQTTTTATTTKPTAAKTPTYPTDANGLPEYVPGSFKLRPQEEDEFEFERKYRSIYYRNFPEYGELVDYDEYLDWLHETVFDGENMHEMALVSFLKRFNIPKDEFEAETERTRSVFNDNKYCDMAQEDWELPNADIIYTFDNEIINHFYRYE